jgi:hypothetical protein
MTPQEITNELSKIEEASYYGTQNPDGVPYEAFAQLHADIKAALLNWARLTGLKITD